MSIGFAGTQIRYSALPAASIRRSSLSSSSPSTVSLASTSTRWASPVSAAAGAAVGALDRIRLVAKKIASNTAHASRLSTSWMRVSEFQPICTSTATMATMTMIDSAGNSHILTLSLSGEVRRRRITCEMAISR